MEKVGGKRGRKRGLSTMVASLLIILLTLVSVGIVWVVIRGVVHESSQQVSLAKLSIDLEIENVQIGCNGLGIIVKRNSGEGELVGIDFVVGDGYNSELFKEYVSMNELEERIFNFNLTNVNPENITEIKIYPILKLDSGTEASGEVENVWKRGSSENYQDMCGGGVGGGGENCDLETPVALDATGITNSSLVANWNAVSDAEGYYLDVALDSGFANLIINNLDVGDVTSYEVNELNIGTMYYYRVRAYESSSCTSDNSNTISTFSLIGYGLLYNWYAVSDSRNIANTGWHVPSRTEFLTLESYLGGYLVAGGKLKETGLTYWDSPNDAFATNEVQFNGRGAGLRASNGAFLALKRVLHLWGLQSGRTANMNVGYNSAETSVWNLGDFDSYKWYGLSVRLIKNSTTLSDGETGTYIGNDGKIYRTICIGTQEWLADNLAETKYRNDNTIPEITNNGTWIALTTGAFSTYGVYALTDLTPIAIDATNITNNSFVANWNLVPAATGYYLDVASDIGFTDFIINNLSVGNVTNYPVTELSAGASYYYRVRAYSNTQMSDNSNKISTTLVISGYGLLYNWYAVNDSRNISPPGWHVATWQDFYSLQTVLGGENIGGRNAKAIGNTYWLSATGTDTVGFNATGAGFRNQNFNSLKYISQWWNSQPAPAGGDPEGIRALLTDIVDYDNIFRTSSSSSKQYTYKVDGLSVRLVKDDSINTGTMTGNDGKVYNTVTIGTQVWMARNLAETKYRNGDIIPEVTNSTEWFGLTTGALCAFNNNWGYM